MSEKYKTYEGGIFFVTLTVVGWIDIFTRKDYSDLLIENLNYCVKNKGLRIHNFVIMPSHLHLISEAETGLLTDILRDFKSYTSKEIIKLIENNPLESRKEWLIYMFKYFANINKHNAKHQFWQQNNHPIDLDNAKIFEQKVDYIHNNPVEAGIVNEPQNYIYSSANPLTLLNLV